MDLVEGVLTPEGQMPRQPGRKGTHLGAGFERLVAPDRIGQCERLFTVIVRVLLRIETAIDEAIVHLPKTGRSDMPQPTDLHRRRLAREDSQSPLARMHRQVDEKVDPVVSYGLR